MNIVVPDEIYKAANEYAKGRGSRQMEKLLAYVEPLLPEGERIIDWTRDGEGQLVAITSPIPAE